jgi:hypothetical protein
VAWRSSHIRPETSQRYSQSDKCRQKVVTECVFLLSFLPPLFFLIDCLRICFHWRCRGMYILEEADASNI